MNHKDILFYSLIIVVLALTIYVTYWIRNDSYKCVSNPVVYGIQQMSSSDEQDIITCSCTSTTSRQVLLFNKTGMSYVNTNMTLKDILG
jgi:hypothetical protein